jgi:hypothetical protein
MFERIWVSSAVRHPPFRNNHIVAEDGTMQVACWRMILYVESDCTTGHPVGPAQFDVSFIPCPIPATVLKETEESEF